MQGEGKLGAYRTKDGAAWDVAADENVLYLGAAQGVTARWMCGIVQQGTVVAVEKSPVAGLGLLRTAKQQSNLVPYVGDARQPDAYGPLVPQLGVLYQDLAQRDQVEILRKNVEAFRPRRAFLALKARSVAVERSPSDVYKDAADALAEIGEVVDLVELDPYHKDHAMIVVDLPTDGDG